MRRTVQTLLLVLAGASLLHVSFFTELYLNYVTPGFRPLLILSGILLVLIGLGAAGRDGFPFLGRAPEAAAPGREGRRPDHVPAHGPDHVPAHGPDHVPAHGPDHGHDHSRGPKVAWLLFLPVLALLFFPPPPLGAYSAARSGDAVVELPADSGPLPDDDPLPMSLTQFTGRTLRDGGQHLEGRTVRLTGFVTPDGDGWYVTRHLVRCCAADSRTLRVRVHGVPAPEADSWVVVTGRWHPEGELGTSSAAVGIDADEVVPAPRPANPYWDVPPDGDGAAR